MATFLESGLLNFFGGIFTFLLVFAIVLAVLEYKKILGSSKGLHSIIALAVAILFVMSKDAISVIVFAAPWFAIVFFFALFILLTFTIFGFEGADFKSIVVGEKRSVSYWIIAVVLIIVALSLSHVFGSRLLPFTSGQAGEAPQMSEQPTGPGTEVVGGANFQQNLWNTIFHPSVLGLALILLIGAFTIRFLSAKD